LDICDILLVADFFESYYESYTGIIDSSYCFIFWSPHFFFIEKRIGPIYTDIVRVFNPEYKKKFFFKLIGKWTAITIAYYLLAYYLIAQLGVGDAAFGIFLYVFLLVVLPIFLVIFYTSKAEAKLSNSYAYSKIILTRTQIIAFYYLNLGYKEIAKFDFEQLEFELQNHNELLLNNTSNYENVLVDITRMPDADKQELINSLEHFTS